MAFEEQGSRIDDLKAILARTAEVATLFDSDGILVSKLSITALLLLSARPRLLICYWCRSAS